MWSVGKEPEKLWAPGASGSAEQRRVSFTHRRSVLGKHCYRGRRRGSGSASSWLFLLSERRGKASPGKWSSRCARAALTEAFGPVSGERQGQSRLAHPPGSNTPLFWAGSPSPRRCGRAGGPTDARRSGGRERRPVRGVARSPPESSDHRTADGWRAPVPYPSLCGARPLLGRGGGVGWGMRFACGFADGQSSSSECSRSLFCLRLFTQHSQLLTSPTPPTLLLSGTLRMKSNLRTPPQKGQKTCIYIYIETTTT